MLAQVGEGLIGSGWPRSRQQSMATEEALEVAMEQGATLIVEVVVIKEDPTSSTVVPARGACWAEHRKGVEEQDVGVSFGGCLEPASQCSDLSL